MNKDLIYQYPINIDDQNSTYGIAYRNTAAESSVLDIGCFNGAFLRKLRSKKKCTVHGIDYNKQALTIAKKSGISVQQLDLNKENALGEVSGTYDTIYLLDVLEHLLHPEYIVMKLPKLLKSDGRVVVSIPNINHIDVIVKLITDGWQRYDDGLLDRTHVNFFASEELIELFEAQGLNLVEEDTVTVPFGLTNLSVSSRKQQNLYALLKPHLNPNEAYTFQKVFIFSRSSQKPKKNSKQRLSSPLQYMLQRLTAFLRLSFAELIDKCKIQ